jgi:predicted nucleotide-binding protein (sugar kinase/HSP70/actin superfamily)
MWHLYIIEKNNKYYTGITTDLKTASASTATLLCSVKKHLRINIKLLSEKNKSRASQERRRKLL